LAFISHLFSRELPFLPIEQGANFATACLRYSSLNWYLRVARNLASRVGSVGALPPEVKRELKQVGVDEGLGVRQIGAQLYKGQIPDIERHSRRQLWGWAAISLEATASRWSARTFWPELIWTTGIRTSYCGRFPPLSTSCLRTSSKHFFKPSESRSSETRPMETESPQTRWWALPRLAHSSTTKRCLALPGMWFSDEPRGTPSTISQPLGRRSRAQPHHLMCWMSRGSTSNCTDREEGLTRDRAMAQRHFPTAACHKGAQFANSVWCCFKFHTRLFAEELDSPRALRIGEIPTRSHWRLGQGVLRIRVDSCCTT